MNAGLLNWLEDYARDNNKDNLPTMEALTTSHEPSVDG
jgi:leucyl aminopeptidase (aminopeptidase T)